MDKKERLLITYMVLGIIIPCIGIYIILCPKEYNSGLFLISLGIAMFSIGVTSSTGKQEEEIKNKLDGIETKIDRLLNQHE